MIIWQGVENPPARCQFGRGVPRWHRQAHDIGECARVVICDLPDQPRNFGSKDRLSRDDLVERSQGSVMISGRDSIKDEPIAQTSREPYPHPSARHRLRILLGRHRIVERPVQMAERNIDRHPGNRELRFARFGHTR
jgi:hypothetical protein